ncbi:phospholipase D [Pisolithus marmoratus]|nr:phospholipase D [Pisolithus marmoratus]
MALDETPKMSPPGSPTGGLVNAIATALTNTSHRHAGEAQESVAPNSNMRVHDRCYSLDAMPSRPTSKGHVSTDDIMLSSTTRASLGPPGFSLPDTPSTRTGPPRSLSYQFTPAYSPMISQMIPHYDEPDSADIYESDDGGHPPHRFVSFRDPLELHKTSSEERVHRRKGVNRPLSNSWIPMRRFQEPSTERKGKEKEKAPIHEPAPLQQDNGRETQVQDRQHTATRKGGIASEALEEPETHTSQRQDKQSSARWTKLRLLVSPMIRRSPSSVAQTHSVVSPEINITDELITGCLSAVMLKLWCERDEKGHRRIPVLLHRLRLRISDSLHPLHSHKAVFRIECEYANGAIRWVIYRQLRDFVSLHTHYTLSNAFSGNKDTLPEFPRTSLPYLKLLVRERRGHAISRADFARLQREALENYLLNLIRAVMWHPSANRLAGFLEISALFVALAPFGGLQYKAGFLRVEIAGNGVNIGRRSLGKKAWQESRWCAVRDSYIVIVNDPGESVVLDVFLLDSEFRVVQPVRYYRKGLHLLRHESPDVNAHGSSRAREDGPTVPEDEATCLSWIEACRNKLSRVLCFGHHSPPNLTSESAERPNSTRLSGRWDDAGLSIGSVVSPPVQSPMVDPSTNQDPLATDMEDRNAEPPIEEQGRRQKRPQDVSRHTFYVQNSQMKLKLTAHNERQMLQWITALEKASTSSPWVAKNRFDSFAPVRTNVAAQWLVDGRDYMWNLSRALMMARETIYIHDWWLSPELELRRPNKLKYRLDNILQRKANEGVKIFIIIYQEVSSRTTPTDSNYTKQKLTSLHHNIMIQRSPSHFQTGTFYWAHHEKVCVIDQTIAFAGGIDLCFGRWDTPQHALVDDPGLSPNKVEIWPGKDYSNPRVVDFHTLNKPNEDMYDRSKIPRMPWHDVGIQVVGQPARDFARHFVQRWNYLLRIKNHSKPMSFLLPPPEFRQTELAAMGLTGTCEMQICRSAGPWSLGTPDRTECSIQNAYVHAISTSEHFVYIENQFFITSTVVNDVEIENKIGDALVKRIIRAHRERTPWRCCIIIPLLPGFPFPIEHGDANAVRIIVECQNRSLFRGPTSIYARLRKENISPNDYISVFSLRNWGKFGSDVLTTEIVYIHAKVCIVDDRLAIIGSANINERSQRGERDSEVAAVIRDTDMIDGTMAGRPFPVGRFAHSLRVRLMREHAGIDVDALSEDEYGPSHFAEPEQPQETWDPHAKVNGVRNQSEAHHAGPLRDTLEEMGEELKQGIVAAGGLADHMAISEAQKHPAEAAEPEALREERMTFTRDGRKVPGFTSAVVPTLEEQTITEGRPPAMQADSSPLREKRDQHGMGDDEPPEAHTTDGQAYAAPANASKNALTDDAVPCMHSGAEDASEEEQNAPRGRSILRKHLAGKLGNKTWTLPAPAPRIDPDDFEDPIHDKFWKNVWVACAVHNTEIYRQVFHAVPDDMITTWKQYTEFVAHHERFWKPPKDSQSVGPASRAHSGAREDRSTSHNSQATRDPEGKEGDTNDKDPHKVKSLRHGVEPFDKAELEEMENLLKETRGHLGKRCRLMPPSSWNSLPGSDLSDAISRG